MTKRFLFFFAAFSSIAIQAWADTYPQTQYFSGSGTPNINGSLTFNQFDNHSGAWILQSIDVSLALQANGGYFILDNDSTSLVSGTFEFGANAALGATDVDLILHDSSSHVIPAQTEACHSGIFNLAANVGDGTGDYDPTGPDGMLYIGGTENNTISGSIGNDSWSSGNTGFLGTGTYNINFSVIQIAYCSGSGIEYKANPPNIFGSVTVTYNYNTIPEPATFAVFSLGMASIFRRKTPITRQKIRSGIL
jgi:hypothetical protein